MHQFSLPLLILLCIVLLICNTVNSLQSSIRAIAAASLVNIHSQHHPSSPLILYAKSNKKTITPIVNEFSRILNIGQLTGDRPVLCKLVAKETERMGLAARFDIPELLHLAANVTIVRRDTSTIYVEGVLEASISYLVNEPETLTATFDTLLLDNVGKADDTTLSFDDNTDYDDEVDEDGNVDVGEIVAQYLSLEL